MDRFYFARSRFSPERGDGRRLIGLFPSPDASFHQSNREGSQPRGKRKDVTATPLLSQRAGYLGRSDAAPYVGRANGAKPRLKWSSATGDSVVLSPSSLLLLLSFFIYSMARWLVRR